MQRFLLHLIIAALALWVTAWILPGVHAESPTALLVAAIVLGVVNGIIRPLLVLLTLPLTFVTLGLFYLVVNGFCFWLMTLIVPGFTVDSFGWAMAGALVVGVVSWSAGKFQDNDSKKD